MATEFTMPKLGLTMEEGTILEWLVPDGATVTEDTPVLLVETDKVETEVNVVASGRLQQLGKVGDTFKCGEVIGLLLAEGESAPVAASPEPAAAPVASVAAPAPTAAPGTVSASPVVATGRSRDASGRLLASPNARRIAAEHGVDLASISGTGPGGRIVSEDVEEAVAAGVAVPPAAPIAAVAPAPRPVAAGPLVPASVAARNLADLLGIDLATVAPDPHERRVTRDAVALHVRSLLAAPGPTPAAGTTAPATPPEATQPPTKVVPLRGMRGTIATRMHASLQTMAQLTLHMDADMDAVVADRIERVRAGAAPGYTDYVIAAAARALRDHPMVNAQVTPDGIALLPDVHVGLAVAVEDGLLVPVVRHADQLSLEDLAEETTRLARAAREKTLGLDELEGGTFSVSALGMFGVDGFTPVINPPNAAILGVGRLRDDVVVVDGHVGTTKRMTLSLTWDHRVLDGAPAAEFCKRIVHYLATPSDLSA